MYRRLMFIASIITLFSISVSALPRENSRSKRHSLTSSPISITTAQLPQSWVNNHECDLPGTGVTTKTIKSNGTGDYAYNCTGLQQSMTDWVAAGDQWWHVLIDPGL